MKCKANITEWFNYILCESFRKWLDDFETYCKLPENYGNDKIATLGKIRRRLFLSTGEFTQSTWKKIIDVGKYIDEHNFYWNVTCYSDNYYALKYGKVEVFIDKKYLYDIVEDNDFENMTLQEVSNHLLGNSSFDTGNYMTTYKDTSISELNAKSKTYEDKLADLKQEFDDVKNCKNDELAELKKQISELQNELEARQNALRAELNEKKAELEEQMKLLENQIYMLKVQIFSIRCFTGDVIELAQLRSGNSMSINTPIVLNQKILYLDEDLAKLMSIYTYDIDRNQQIFEECIKYNDEVMETFCPQPKCVSFFKCSKGNKDYSYHGEFKMLSSYDLLHGNQIGFLVRNGENLYIGWLPEEWDKDVQLTFNDSVIYKPNVREVTEEENVEVTSKNHMVSRLYALNVVQGLIEHESILAIPEKVNIQTPNKYVIHNYADGWIDDNRYGDFSVLVKNLNYYRRVGDKLLVIMRLGESNEGTYQATRSIGDLNTTRNCYVECGLYNLSVIKDSKTFISVKKDGWVEYKNNANFSIDENEYINLTFMNTIWLKYFIDTKKIGNFGKYVNKWGYEAGSLDYSYLIRYFKEAYEYLLAMEKVYENSLRMLEDESFKLDNYSNWIELLSHWRIKKDVHRMTPTQYKRFKKYLLSGDYFKMSNLFGNVDKEEEISYIKNEPNLTNYYATRIYDMPERHIWYRGDNDKDNPYHYLSEEENKQFNETTSDEKIQARYEKDFSKLVYIYDRLRNYAEMHDLEDYSKHKIFKDYINNVIEKLNVGYHVWYEDVAGKIFNHCITGIDPSIINIMHNELISYEQDHFTNNRKFPKKLCNLAFLLLIQLKIIPEILNGITKALEYDYKYQIEKI